MLTTSEIVEKLRLLTETGTKYAAAKLIGVRPQTLDNWLIRGSVMNDETALLAASKLDLDPDYVLACLAAERAKDTPAYETWANICERLTPKKRRKAA